MDEETIQSIVKANRGTSFPNVTNTYSVDGQGPPALSWADSVSTL